MPNPLINRTIVIKDLEVLILNWAIKIYEQIIINKPKMINFIRPNLSESLPPKVAAKAIPNDWKINIKPTLDSLIFNRPVKNIGIIIIFPDIAKKAKKLGTNARGLRNILDTLLLPYQFDAAEMFKKGVDKITITEQCVDNNEDPVLHFKTPVNEMKKTKAKN